MMASHCFACSAGMIPSNPVFRQTALTPIILANALPMSMSEPTGLLPGPYDSNGGNETSTQKVILPALAMLAGGLIAAADADADAPSPAASEATTIDRLNFMLDLPSRDHRASVASRVLAPVPRGPPPLPGRAGTSPAPPRPGRGRRCHAGSCRAPPSTPATATRSEPTCGGSGRERS